MKLIQMINLTKAHLVVFMILSLIVGFPSVLASDDEPKPEQLKNVESKSQDTKEFKEKEKELDSKATPEKPIEKTAEKSTEKDGEKNTEKTGEKNTEKTGEKNTSDSKNAEKKDSEAKNTSSRAHSKSRASIESKSNGQAASNDYKALAEAKGCIVDHAALEDLKRVKEELDERSRELTSKEGDLKAREKVIADELRNLEKIRDDISRNSEQKSKDKDARVAKLVDTFLTMSPKAAAKVLMTLDDNLAVSAMLQMDTIRLAKIMNNMDPVRSSHLSELLAGSKKNKEPVPTKKGEG